MNRAWTYIINKELSQQELELMREKGKKFVEAWTAHEQKLTGDFTIFKDRIILVTVNENVNAASGCSIDKLTRFIKQLELEFGLELMNRLLVAYENKGKVNMIHSSKIKELLNSGEITGNTIIYNTSVSNQEELKNWEQPLKDTWLNKNL